ncbi:predicted protein [Botrytis cinerea T4]|uniref:Uncharacterized protein n=1 Tax=Botryotinia fuckeliana (strain T4) TaxID=999810 RepID=G2YZE5_BOTF4|nr:predicted protein [Botrytis cinerea T4]
MHSRSVSRYVHATYSPIYACGSAMDSAPPFPSGIGKEQALGE